MLHGLALTFDDGPDLEGTPAILDALRRVGVVATFFVIAGKAAAHPRIVQRMLDDGHAVGFHCDEHERHSAHDRAWCADDADRGLRRLRALGLRPGLWRTPWGDVAPWSGEVAAEHHLRLVGWSVDTHDWRGDDVEQMWLTTGLRLRPGTVVLAHDGIGPGARRRDVAHTVAYIDRIATHAADAGLAMEALS